MGGHTDTDVLPWWRLPRLPSECPGARPLERLTAWMVKSSCAAMCPPRIPSRAFAPVARASSADLEGRGEPSATWLRMLPRWCARLGACGGRHDVAGRAQAPPGGQERHRSARDRGGSQAWFLQADDVGSAAGRTVEDRQ